MSNTIDTILHLDPANAQELQAFHNELNINFKDYCNQIERRGTQLGKKFELNLSVIKRLNEHNLKFSQELFKKPFDFYTKEQIDIFITYGSNIQIASITVLLLKNHVFDNCNGKYNNVDPFDYFLSLVSNTDMKAKILEHTKLTDADLVTIIEDAFNNGVVHPDRKGKYIFKLYSCDWMGPVIEKSALKSDLSLDNRTDELHKSKLL